MKIGITMGDPKGIGPEVISKALRDPRVKSWADYVVYGEDVAAKEWNAETCGHASISYLEKALQDAIDGKIDAMVTAPISKAHLQKAAYPWPGHTEFLAERTGSQKVVMMMAAPQLKVSLVTIHMPLKEVPKQISEEKIIDTVRITFDSLQQYWRILNPRVAVCALNPHAGEEGLLGDEEIRVIQPALEKLRRQGYQLEGPCVPDAVFHQAYEGEFDAVVCMYHDQGLIPFKMLYFQEGVNVTLGLPIIRTSPDHGTAFDIVGKGVANPSSMIAAIELAVEMAKKRDSLRGVKPFGPRDDEEIE